MTISKNGRHRPLRAWDFACVASEGFGEVQNNRAQSMAWICARLYAFPAGRVRGECVEKNAAKIPTVFENADPAVAPWRLGGAVGFVDPSKSSVYESASRGTPLKASSFRSAD